MNNFENFNNKYSLGKTLRFSLIPIGDTSKYMSYAIEEGNHKAEAYKKVKVMIDELHRNCINNILNEFVFSIKKLNDLYNAFESLKAQNKKVQNSYNKIQSDLTKSITDFIDQYKKKPLNIKDKKKNGKIIAKGVMTLLNEHFRDEEARKNIQEFEKYSTYFSGYNMSREHMYKTQISARVMHNLSEHMNNVRLYQQIKDEIPDRIKQLNEELQINADTVFTVEYFNYVLTQDGINKYNMLIGGKADKEGAKTKGINEYINEYNSVHKQTPLPKMTQLYKQILSDVESESFRYFAIETEAELLELVNAYYEKLEKHVLQSNEFKTLFEEIKISEYDLNKVHIKIAAINGISAKVFQNWKFISSAMANKLGKNKNIQKIINILEDEENHKPKNDTIHLSCLKECLPEDKFAEIITYFNKQITIKINAISKKQKSYTENQQLKTISRRQRLYDTNRYADIKELLEEIKQLQFFMSSFCVDKTVDTDTVFYNIFNEKYDILWKGVSVYNQARNFITKKPYSLNKIKLKFLCPTLLAGWDYNKEGDNLSIILRKDGIYYLGIINKDNKKKVLNALRRTNQNLNEECFEKMRYKQIPGATKSLPKKFFSKKGKVEFKPSESLINNYKQKHHKQENPAFDINFLHELIDFYKKSIEQCEWKEFDFIFKDTAAYQNINEFYEDVDEQAYKISFGNIPAKQILDLVKDGALYLFEIYNKDFSPASHGNPNLHTIYWKALFDKDNLRDVVYKLNGEAEIFWRKKSIRDEDIIRHKANEPIPCRRDPKKQSVFAYELIKDKRFTEDLFQLHVPITLNFKANGQTNIDQEALLYIKDHIEDISILGIDRGEKNLLYYSLIDTKGHIKEQGSLNIIDGVDYHKLLMHREQERNDSRQNWTAIGKIKDLKTGYLSQAIHKVTDLMIKNHAIIVLENLNNSFKKSRVAIDHAVYQKFEKMLVDKLNYLVMKNQKDQTAAGGLMKAYQLASCFDSMKDLNFRAQSGFLFYVSPWMTSAIDPTTGFIDFLDTNYKNISESHKFITNLVDIRYDQDDGYFEFETSCRSNCMKQSMAKLKLKKDWVICSYGDRIVHYKKNNKNISERIDLTQAFKDLFNEYQIRLDHIKEDILNLNDKNFFEKFMKLFKYMLQLRNSLYEEDYILSPVKNMEGKFFDSRECGCTLPNNADANGAYNIARKGLIIVEKIKASSNLQMHAKQIRIVKNDEWINFYEQQRQ